MSEIELKPEERAAIAWALLPPAQWDEVPTSEAKEYRETLSKMLTSPPSSASPLEWQGMESAPHGKYVLIGKAGHPTKEARTFGSIGWGAKDRMPIGYEPTHWMLLPSPPKQEDTPEPAKPHLIEHLLNITKPEPAKCSECGESGSVKIPCPKLTPYCRQGLCKGEGGEQHYEGCHICNGSGLAPQPENEGEK